MRVLFFVEPLVERENPTWKAAWLDNFTRRIYQALSEEGLCADNVACIAPSALGGLARELLPESRIASIDQCELVPCFGSSALVVATRWYENSATLEAHDAMAVLVKQRLGDFEPTHCITFSPAPYLKRAWPDSKVLHLELGVFSRAPFSETVYFDPIGMFRAGVLAKHAESIRAHYPSSGELALVDQLRRDYCSFSSDESNPLAAYARALLVGFESAVLVALQFSNFYAYDANAEFTDQLDVLLHCLDRLPRNVAVVACEHPEHLVLKDETIAYLRRRYSNFVWHPSFRVVYGASHYLMPYVQGIVTVSSSVGLQALLWRKKLVVMGKSHLSAYADTDDVTQLPALLGGVWPIWKDAALAWIVANFHLPFEGLLASGRMTMFMNALQSGVPVEIESAREQAGFTAESLANIYSQAWRVRPDSPQMASVSFSEDIFVAALFVAADGEVYSEQRCLRQIVDFTGSTDVTLKFRLAGRNAFPSALRFDPANRQGTWRLLELSVVDAIGHVAWQWDGAVDSLWRHAGMALMPLDRGVMMLCDTIDPQIELEIDFPALVAAPRPLVLQVRIARGTVAEAVANAREACFVKDGRIAELHSNLAEVHAEMASLGESVPVLQRSLAEKSVEADTQRARSATLERLRNDLLREVEVFEGCLSDREAQISDMETRASELLLKVSAADEEVEALHSRLAEAEREAAGLQTLFVSLERDKRDLVAVGEGLHASNESLQEEINDLVKRVAEHERVVGELSHKYNQQIDCFVRLAKTLDF